MFENWSPSDAIIGAFAFIEHEFQPMKIGHETITRISLKCTFNNKLFYIICRHVIHYDILQLFYSNTFRINN